MTAALRSLPLVLTFCAIFAGVYALASAPTRVPSYLGVRGMKRARALETNALWSNLEPLVRWLGMRCAPLLSEGQRHKLDRLITVSGDFWGLLPEELVSLSMVSCAAGLVGGVTYGVALGKGLLYVVICTAFGAALPYLYISGLENDRRKKVQNSLPWVIDLLALGLSAGLDFPGSLRQVVEKSTNPSDPVIEESNLILQELQVGKTRKQALQQLAERVPGESVKEFVGAVVQAEERGNPLGEVLRIQAETSRQRRSVRAEEIASKTGVKLLVPMVLLMGAVMILIVAPLMLDLNNTLMN